MKITERKVTKIETIIKQIVEFYILKQFKKSPLEKNCFVCCMQGQWYWLYEQRSIYANLKWLVNVLP